MPVTSLYVEGNLETELLTPVLQGSPLLRQGGSKNSLKPRAIRERLENKVNSGYLRDRDFDFDPPSDLSNLVIDGIHQGVAYGWRWCRHEIENYLIDPAIVTEAMNWAIEEYENAIRQVAVRIKSYEAARWTVGIIRRALPPNYELNTRPDGLNEIDLPQAIDTISVNSWAHQNIENYQKPLVSITSPIAVQSSFDAILARFNDEFVSDVRNTLVWFSGKDILAGLREWLATKVSVRFNPGAFRASLRDWIRSNPDRTLKLIPEWKSMIDTVRA